MPRLLSFHAIHALIFLSSSTGFAEEPPAVPADGRLTRRAAAQIAAARNYGFLIEKMEKRIKKLGVEAAHRDYAPVLRIDGGYDGKVTRREDQSGVLFDSQKPWFDYGGRLSWKAPIGTEVGLETSVDRFPPGENDHNASLELGLKQPLLKDGWGAGAATPLRRAELDARKQTEVLRSKLNDLLVEVEKAYGELAFAQADLEIKQRSRDVARRQFEDTRENIRRGILAEAEIFVVEENLVRFESQLIQAHESLEVARRNLARVLAVDPNGALVATDALDWSAMALPQPETAVSEALSSNPDLRSRALELKRAEIDLSFEANQRLPSLDLEASLGVRGFGDTLGGAFEEIGERRRPEGRVGLVFEVLLDGDPDWAKREAARTEVRKSELELRDRKAELGVEIRNLVTRLTALLERLQRAVRLVELGERKLAAEEEKYRNGVTTLTEVVRFQRDLDEAQIGVKRNQRELWDARARFLRATGTLHRFSGIAVD